MSVERYIYFKDLDWFHENEKLIIDNLKKLHTYLKSEEDNKIVYLKEKNKIEGDWDYDIRFFFKKDYIFFEISSHGEEITFDLKYIFNWLRSKTQIVIQDEDGEESKW
ncbi:hypothetical protein OHV78_17605 [Acinetobacter baumannii]|nr:hypothetical protein [Acinetobacter baumannii]MDC5166874.1 hypothetical protein [Acinetobacter baumannii]